MAGIAMGSVLSGTRAVSLIAEESDLQMGMYDELGPKARRALDDCLREPNIRALKSAFKRAWVDAWWEKQGIEGTPPPQKTFAELDDEFTAFILEKTKVLCPLTGKPLTCLVPKKLKRSPPSRFGKPARSYSASSQS